VIGGVESDLLNMINAVYQMVMYGESCMQKMCFYRLEFWARVCGEKLQHE